MDKSLREKYGICLKDALISDLYGYCHKRGNAFRIFKIVCYAFFKLRAKRYKRGVAIHDFGALERYFCESNYGFSVGRYSYGIWQFCFGTINLQSIGAFCSLAPGITITGQNHPLHYITTHPILYRSDFGAFIRAHREDRLDEGKNRKVVIGNDVWIGQNVIILPSVKIGDGATVGAGSVVTKDVPNYAVVAGNPASVIRYRFSPDEIAALEEIRWWDWDDDEIRARIDTFTDPTRFLAEFRDGSETLQGS